MLSIVVAALLASSGAEPVKLAATGLSGVGISEAQAEFFTEHLAEKLTAHGFAVVTPKEIATLLGMERQKQLLGCADDASSCVSEIANALGADGLVLGTIAKIGSAYQVDLKVLGAQNAKRLGSYSSKVRSEEEILDALAKGSEQMALQVALAMGRPAPVVKSGSPVRTWAWVPGAAGVVFAAGGVYGLVQADSVRQRFTTDRFTMADANQSLEDGKTARTLGWVGVGLGAAGLATSALLYTLVKDEAQIVPSVSVSQGAAGVSISGVLP